MRTLTLLLLITIPFLATAQSKKDKKRYAEFITTADSAFDAKNYPLAKDKYKAASAIKPKEQYPITRIAECDRLYPIQIAEYRKLIAQADSCFEKKDWITAKTFYLRANSVKPNDQYSSDQAKNCNYQIVAKQAMEDRYNEAIRMGDSCYNARSWACAKANYEAASRTKPEQKYPIDRIAECEKKITPAVNKERYEITISDADRQFDAGNYARAKELYNEALMFNPGAKYALDRIMLCDEKMNAPK